MLVYSITSAILIAFVSVAWLQRRCKPGTSRSFLCTQLKALLGACLLAGLICSVLQVIIVLSDDYEATGRALGRIESRLRLHQRLAHVFTLTDAQLVALGAVLAALAAVALVGTRLTLRRAVIRWKDACAAV